MYKIIYYEKDKDGTKINILMFNYILKNSFFAYAFWT